MAGARERAIEELAQELLTSGWWNQKPRVFVSDFGYEELSIYRSDTDIAVNIPGSYPAADVTAPVGVAVTCDQEGVIEAVAAGERDLEIVCIDGRGRLQNASDASVLARRVRTAALLESAALQGDADRFCWAASRLAHLAITQRQSYFEAPPLVSLVDDHRAAAIAGVEQARWNALAAAAHGHLYGSDAKPFWHALVTTNDAGHCFSPAALLVLSYQTWGPVTVDALQQSLLLPVDAIEGALRELVEAGLVAWPATLEHVVQSIGMAELRDELGPRGIKAQSKAQLVERALDALGADEVTQIAVSLGADLTQPAFLETAERFRSSFEVDARAERIDRMASHPGAALSPSGLPGDFGDQDSRRLLAEVHEEDSDPPPVPAAEGAVDIEALGEHLDAAVDLAAQAIASPGSTSQAISMVQITITNLVGLLADAAASSVDPQA